MNLNDYDFLGLIGHSLSVPEKTAIKVSLMVLGERLHTPISLWGKIMGIYGDYLIAQTTPATGSVEDARLSFFSNDGGNTWHPLTSSLTPDQEVFSEGIRGRFMGVPEYEYKIRKDIPPEEQETSKISAAKDHLKEKSKNGEDDEEAEEKREEDEEDEEEAHEENDEQKEEGEEEVEEDEIDEDVLKRKKPKAIVQILKLTEDIRVAHFVMKHDLACRLLVRGAYVLNEKTGKIVPNRTFMGLDIPQALKLRNFLKLSTFPKKGEDDDKNVVNQRQQHEQQSESAAPHEKEGAAVDQGVLQPPLVLSENGKQEGDNDITTSKLPLPKYYTAEERKALIKSNNRKWFGPDYNEYTDFLATVAEDMPRGIWTLKYDSLLGVVGVRNLLYNGSLFWYCPNTARFGQMYFGTGERDLDLCWELPKMVQ